MNNIITRSVRYSSANAKTQLLNSKTYSFDLLAGYSCPAALKCKSQATEIQLRNNNGTFGKKVLRIKDGPYCEYRCFSANQEARIPNVYYYRKRNYNIIKSTRGINNITKLLQSNLPIDAEIIRLHVSGDFFKQEYFLAWLQIAKCNKDIVFYSYTKMLPMWIKFKQQIPSNFILTASYGGKHDDLIKSNCLKSARVVLSVEEANKLNLPIDKTDAYAIGNRGNFALLIHGHQPKGSDAAKAWYKLGKRGYNRKKKDVRKIY